MAATQIKSMVDGIVMFQCGYGVPEHVSPFGSEYTDLNTQIKYHNKGAKNNWVPFIDGNDISTIISGATFTGGTVNGPTNFTSGLSADTITATTYIGLPTTNNGGGQIYYLNGNETNGGYSGFKTNFDELGESTVTKIVDNNGVIIDSFITSFSYPNSPIVPGGLWSFYLNLEGQNTNDDVIVWCEVYVVNSFNAENQIFDTEPIKISSINTTLISKYFNGCNINKDDRILVKVWVKSNGPYSETIALKSEGNIYSYIITSFHLSIDDIILDGGYY